MIRLIRLAAIALLPMVAGLAVATAQPAEAQVCVGYTSTGGCVGLGIGPIQPGSTLFMEGDSLILGTTGPTSCISGTNFKTLVAPALLTGTCFADLLGAFYKSSVYNIGTFGTCLQFTVTDPNNNCNQASTASGSLINRYPSDFTHLTPGMWFYQLIGTNDAFAWSNGDTLLNAATFKANLQTELAAAAAIVGASHIILGEIPFTGVAYQSYINILNQQIDDVAIANGYTVASLYSGIQTCAIANPSDTNQCYGSTDRVHPDNNGHAVFAQLFEQATYPTAVAGIEANRKSVAANYRQDGSSNVTCGGFSTLLQLQTGTNNTTCGFNSTTNVTVATDNDVSGAFAYHSGTTGGFNVIHGSAAGSTLTGSSGNNLLEGYNACGSVAQLNQMVCLGNASAPSGTGQNNGIIIGSGLTGIGSNSIAIQTGNAPGYFSGTGVPSKTSPNSSWYLRYDSNTPGSRVYINTCASASTSCNTWVATAL